MTLAVKLAIFAAAGAAFLAACTDADIASHNLSQAADNFEIQRRVVFYNGITDTPILAVEGRCAMGYYSQQVTVTCKIGPDEYKRHMLGLSDNVTYFVEQIDAVPANPYRYRVIFKPSTLVPNVEAKWGW